LIWYLLGAFVGDFYVKRVTNRSIRLCFGSSNYNNLKWGYAVHSNFGQVKMYPRHSKTSYAKDVIVELCTSLPRCQYEVLLISKHQIINYVIRQSEEKSDLKIIFDFLSGYVDADGDVTAFHDRRRTQYRVGVRITSTMRDQLVKIRDFLKSRTFSTYIIERIRRNKRIASLVTHDIRLLSNLNLQHHVKKTRLEIIKKYGETTFEKTFFEVEILPRWLRHEKGGSSRWLTEFRERYLNLIKN